MRSMLLSAVLSATGCSWISGVPLDQETVTAACGSCVFKQETPGCYWAIEWEGDYYPVNGPLPKDHDSHGPEGMCLMARQAVVSGRIRGGQLYADRFELLPVAPGATQAPGTGHEHDHGSGWTGQPPH